MSSHAEIDRDDPEALKRKADAIRADLDRTLDALERKLSPRQLLDRSLAYAQANGGTVLHTIGAAVNKNPLPVLLTSAVLMWLAASRRRSQASRFDVPSTSPRRGDFDRASQSFERSRLRGAANQIKRRASRTYDSTRERTFDAGRDVSAFMQEQPLVCGAIAVAIGAVIGAALPASQLERDLIARARASASPLFDQVAETLRGKDASEATSSPASH